MTVMEEQQAEILDKAADVIDERGLHRGYYVPDYVALSNRVELGRCPVCLVGGVNVAAGRDADQPDEHDGTFAEALDALCEHLGLADEVRALLEANPDPPDEHDQLHARIVALARWSDDPLRTKEQVISELRACAAVLRGGA